MEDVLLVGEEGTGRRLLWDSGSTGRAEGCPIERSKNVNVSKCLGCIHYGGFFDCQNRALNVPQVAIGAGRVRRAVNVVCNTTTEALEAAIEARETAKEKDLRTQAETAKKKGPSNPDANLDPGEDGVI